MAGEFGNTYDLRGLAEDVENIIYNISPMDTVMFNTAKKKKATAVRHDWQVDSLASAVNTNAVIEGADATYGSVPPTAVLSNYCQISRKTLMVSKTADVVRKYGRAEEFAYQLSKRGKELKRDIETRILQNGQSSAGTSTAAARMAAGFEAQCYINYAQPTTSNAGTTSAFTGGLFLAPTDGTKSGAGSTLSEAYLKTALQAAWDDGGDPTLILMPAVQKAKAAAFAGATSFSGNQVTVSKNAQGVVMGAVDLYRSDFGLHTIKLSRYMRARNVFCIDPDYVSLAWLRPIKYEELAKVGDATRGMLIGEWTFCLDNPNAHAKVVDLFDEA
jgi:hypothetical protein